MTTARSVSSSVEVAIDPATAFRVFTEELNLWWVRGPINFYDSARAVEKRCEPGVGGRILEVYDDAAGDVLELARITVWDPGSRLSWRSSLDGVDLDVYFEPLANGTRVRVEASVRSGEEDRGGSAWVRVVPPWFGAWCAKRDRAPHEPHEIARLGLAVYYERPATAARWLSAAFGLESTNPIPDSDDAQSWIEFRVGNCSLMVFRQQGKSAQTGEPTHVPWIYVDNLEATLARALEHGATIVEPIRQHGYRAFVAEDPEARRWTIAQARPAMRL